jgi:hypothetical protein
MMLSKTINEFCEVVRSRRESTTSMPMIMTVANVAGKAIDFRSMQLSRAIASEIKKYAIS